MRQSSVSTLGLVCLLLVAATAGHAQQAPPQAGQAWTARYPLAAGGRVSVTNVQGSLWVEGWDRAEVELTVVKRSTSADDGVRVAVDQGADWFEARTVYPPEAGGVQVDYTLRVPRQVRLESLQTVNGDIRVVDVEGSVTARTLNGDIQQTGIAGSVRARTLNGRIAVALRALPGRRGTVQLEAINGDVRLGLPPRANAELELNTVAGRVLGERVLEASRRSDDSTLRVRVGRGGPRVQVHTVRGDILVVESEDVL